MVGDLAGFAASTLLPGACGWCRSRPRCSRWSTPPSAARWASTTCSARTFVSLPSATGGGHRPGPLRRPSRTGADSAPAEVVKIAPVADGALFEEMECSAAALAAGTQKRLAPVVRRAVEAKVRIVRDDEHELGARAFSTWAHGRSRARILRRLRTLPPRRGHLPRDAGRAPDGGPAGDHSPTPRAPSPRAPGPPRAPHRAAASRARERGKLGSPRTRSAWARPSGCRSSPRHQATRGWSGSSWTRPAQPSKTRPDRRTGGPDPRVSYWLGCTLSSEGGGGGGHGESLQGIWRSRSEDGRFILGCISTSAPVPHGGRCRTTRRIVSAKSVFGPRYHGSCARCVRWRRLLVQGACTTTARRSSASVQLGTSSGDTHVHGRPDPAHDLLRHARCGVHRSLHRDNPGG